MRLRRSGFTLIELLVVIAIIAVLASIMFPVLTRAREQARVSVCASNMKEIYMALAMYCDSSNGFLPDSKPINFYVAFTHPGQVPNEDQSKQIHFLLAPYLSNKTASYDKNAVFHCPGDRIVPPMTSGVFDTTSSLYDGCVFAKWGSSYQWGLGHDNTDTNSYEGVETTYPLSGKKMSSFMHPSQIGAARDAQPWHRFTLKNARSDWSDPNNGGNVLFLEGHVKFVLGSEFLARIY